MIFKDVKTAVLFIVSVSSFTSAFMMSSIVLALPSIQNDLSADAVSLGFVVMGYLIANGVFLIPIGKLSDIYGKQKIYHAGMMLFGMATLLAGLAQSINFLLFMRVLQGIAASLRIATGTALVAAIFPPDERGKAFGIWTAFTYAGVSSGPAIGGIMTQHFGWRSIFLLNVPVTLILFLIGLFILKNEKKPERKKSKFDFFGSVLYGVGMTICIYGAILLPEKLGIFLTLSGIISIVCFLGWEKYAENPIIDVPVLVGNRNFTFSCIATFACYVCTYSIPFLMSLFLQYIKEITPQTAGVMLLSQPILQTLFSPISGRYTDRMEPKIIASIGMAVANIGLIMLAFIEHDTTISYIMIAFILAGIGYGIFSTPNTYAVMNSVDEKDYGIASAVLSTMRTGGMITSMAFTTSLFALFIGRNKITYENYDDLLFCIKIAFAISILVCTAGLYFSLNRGAKK